jgi:hypothetical protein
MIEIGAFAPALEHGHSSNEEEGDGDHRKNLQQHHNSS